MFQCNGALHQVLRMKQVRSLEAFTATQMANLYCFRILDALSDALSLQREFFHSAFNPPMTFLRPLHYSATRSCPEQGVLGAGPHTDYGMLTLLPTDGTPGLQILQGETWVDVEAVPGGLIVNFGDMLERYETSQLLWSAI